MKRKNVSIVLQLHHTNTIILNYLGDDNDELNLGFAECSQTVFSISRLFF